MLRISSYIFVLLTTLSTFGFADNGGCCSFEEPCLSCPEANFAIESKVGYFFFSDSKMRKIYDRGGLDLQISGTYSIWNWLQIFGSVEYLEIHGRSLNGHQKAKIWEVPVSLGLRSVIPICQQIQYYFTLGPRYFFVHAHNSSCYVERNMSKTGFGGFANTGFNFFLCDNLFLGVFGEYSYGRFHFHSSRENSYGESAQVGGFAFGAGLGYVF
jgi:outer membrane protein